MYNDMKIANADFAQTLGIELARLNKEKTSAEMEMNRAYKFWKKIHEEDTDLELEIDAWKIYDDASNWYDLVDDAIYNIKDLLKMYGEKKGE